MPVAALVLPSSRDTLPRSVATNYETEVMNEMPNSLYNKQIICHQQADYFVDRFLVSIKLLQTVVRRLRTVDNCNANVLDTKSRTCMLITQANNPRGIAGEKDKKEQKIKNEEWKRKNERKGKGTERYKYSRA